jgi:hypothetical protein
LKDRCPVHPHDGRIGIFILLAVTHVARGQFLSFMNGKWKRFGIPGADIEVAMKPVGLELFKRAELLVCLGRSGAE